MADLSPAAQAVKDHFLANVPIGLEPGLAAALRAAADQMIDDRCQNESEKRIYDRSLRIATELEVRS
jgi:hypothetical protein